MSPIKHTLSPLKQAVNSVGSIISESVLNNSLICSRLAVHSIKSSQNWFSSCLQVFNPCWDILWGNNHQRLTKEEAPHLTRFFSFQEYISQKLLITSISSCYLAPPHCSSCPPCPGSLPYLLPSCPCSCRSSPPWAGCHPPGSQNQPKTTRIEKAFVQGDACAKKRRN